MTNSRRFANLQRRFSAPAGSWTSLALLALVLLCSTLRSDSGPSHAPSGFLSETGLYSDFAAKALAPANLKYSPQYPLWSDGAVKQRWIYLPPGQTIDARDADNWVFPVGTKLWKEFSFGQRTETRLLEKTAPEEWTYATYAWNDEGSDAVLVSERGSRNHVEIAPGIRHDIPGVNDCKACHEGHGRDVVLGFNALQLSPDRDTLAPHTEAITPDMINLETLIEQGCLSHLPKEFRRRAPKINTKSPRARAALGYLWANCGGCHNASDPLSSVGMYLKAPISMESSSELAALQTVIGHESKFKIPGAVPDQCFRIRPGDPSQSTLVYRMQTRNPLQQMPPLGTKIVDREAVELIVKWIEEDLGDRPVVHE